MPPYSEQFPTGTKVRVADRERLDAFLRSWNYHHGLRPEQLKYADYVTEVTNVTFYHGGAPLYELQGVPGIWHEQCLTPHR
jgi:hypothetical protein